MTGNEYFIDKLVNDQSNNNKPNNNQSKVNDKSKKFKKAKVRVAAAILALGTLASFANCVKPSKQNTETQSVQTNYVEQVKEQNKEQAKQEAKKKEIKSIDDINPTFGHKMWQGSEYVTIDEESLKDIIKLAMNDARELYLSVGARNMNLDKNGNPKEGKENFYPSWMTENYFLATAKREVTEDFMINFNAKTVERNYNLSQGVMAITPDSLFETLENYFANTYHKEVNFKNLQIAPTIEEAQLVGSSNQVAKNVTREIYNNVFSAICYDIYQAKNMGPNHADYYDSFGGYSEEIRQRAVTGAYLFGITSVINSLKDGTFEEKYANTKYVTDILNYQNEYEKTSIQNKKSGKISTQNELDLEEQMQMQ